MDEWVVRVGEGRGGGVGMENGAKIRSVNCLHVIYIQENAFLTCMVDIIHVTVLIRNL